MIHFTHSVNSNSDYYGYGCAACLLVWGHGRRRPEIGVELLS